MDAKELGRTGEEITSDYLIGLGWEILDRNWRFSGGGLRGELDVIARQPDRSVVDVEVKTRSGSRYGTGFEAITTQKAAQLRALTARWLASQLGVPLYVLDLTAVMSSLLGRSGSNLRAALDFAKRSPCVLLLDEIDAIAKRRSDDTDIGELKRLVTVILQEVDEWPATGLLLAATNHAELIDPALWRRFDLVINFKAPEMPAVKQAIKRFLGPDYALFGRWIDILTFAFNGESFSDIERDLQRFRRAVALGTASDADLIEEFVKSRALVLERQGRIDLAVLLAKQTRLSQHTISDITGVSRDTIRKYTSEQPVAAKKTSKGKPEA